MLLILANSEVSKSNSWTISSFSKTTLLQREPFFTMFYTICLNVKAFIYTFGTVFTHNLQGLHFTEGSGERFSLEIYCSMKWSSSSLLPVRFHWPRSNGSLSFSFTHLYRQQGAEGL